MMNMRSSVRHNVGFIIERTPIVVVLFVSLVLIGAAVDTLVDWAGSARASRVDREDIFEYVSIGYVDIDPEDGEGLVMESTRVWHRQVTGATFVNELRCDGVLTSTYSAPVGSIGPEPLSTAPWLYDAGHPSDGRECFVRAEITAEYQGRLYTQRLDSVPFNPTGR